jgi:hypothetical protein
VSVAEPSWASHLPKPIQRLFARRLSWRSWNIEYSRAIYEGLYDFEKHQDDKIGRFLTAIAFLATAAAAIGFANSQFLATRYKFDTNSTINLPAILLAAFFVLLGLTLLILLTSLGPNVTFPRRNKEIASPSGRDRKDPESVLFDLSIVKTDPAVWNAMLRGSDRSAKARISRMYHQEAHNIALNAEFKYDRNNEANAIFGFALLLFALAVLLGAYGYLGKSLLSTAPVRTDASGSTSIAPRQPLPASAAIGATPAAGSGPTIEWDLRIRIVVGFVIAAFTSFQLYELYRLRQVDRWAGLLWTKNRSLHPLALSIRFLFGRFSVLGAAATALSFGCLFAVRGSPRSWAAGVVLGAAVIGSLSIKYIVSAIDWPPAVGTLVALAFVSVGIGAGAMLLLTHHVIFVCAFSLAPPALLCLPRLLRPWIDWEDRRKAIAKDFGGLLASEPA